MIIMHVVFLIKSFDSQFKRSIMNPSNLCDTQLSIDDWELDTSSSSWLDREDELMHLLDDDDDESDNMLALTDSKGEAIVPDDAVYLDSFLVGSDVLEDESSSHFHEFECTMADDRSFILPDSSYQEQSNDASRSSIEKHIAIIGELMEKSECSRRLIEKLVPSSNLSSPKRKSIASYIAGISKKTPSTVPPPAVCSEDEESLSSLSEAVFCDLSSMPSVLASKPKPSPKKRRQRQVKQGAKKKKKQAPRNPKNLTAASFEDKSYQSTGLIVRNGLSLKIKPSREDVSKTGRAGKKRMLAVAAKKQQHARRITSTCQSC